MKSTNKKQNKNNSISTHLVCDMWGCDFSLAEDEKALSQLAVSASKKSKGTVIDVTSYKFKPQGATVVVLLAESHLSIHTWPEHDYIGVDVFTCGDKMNPKVALEIIEKALKPKRLTTTELARGENA